MIVLRYGALGLTDGFKVEVGLHQRLFLSPFLFAMVMDTLTDEVRQDSLWMICLQMTLICRESREQVE